MEREGREKKKKKKKPRTGRPPEHKIRYWCWLFKLNSSLGTLDLLIQMHTLYSETRDLRLKTCQWVKNPCRISRLNMAIFNQFHYLGGSWACFMIQNWKEQKNMYHNVNPLVNLIMFKNGKN